MRVIDSHTEGEPTRVIVEGGPDLGLGSVRDQMRRFRDAFDDDRQFAITEPRGCDAMVGALLCEPSDSSCATGVIFFNNVGFLGMCCHGAIGVVVTLAYLKRIHAGDCRLETPVGVVEARLLQSNRVAVTNVASYRYRADVQVTTETMGVVVGDVAWGGNWFFLVDRPPLALTGTNIRKLSDAAEEVRCGLRRQQITGPDGEEIDHVEFFGKPESPDADSRNFVSCPGGAYDRSPCGTGTSAKLACLASDGKLPPGQPWVQESIIGSRFTASYFSGAGEAIIPTIIGNAYVCAEAQLIRQPEDPYRYGIRVGGSA